MEFTVDAGELKRACDIMAMVVEERKTTPIFSTVKFEATEAGVHAHATNTERGVSIFLPSAKTVKPGESCCSAKKLKSLAHRASGTVSIAATKATATVRLDGGGTYRLPAIDAREFPTISDAGNEAELFSIPASELLFGLGTVRHAVSDDETRPQLSGIYCRGERVVATDGHRLSIAEMGTSEFPGDGFIISESAIAVLEALSAGDDDVVFSLTSGAVFFESGDVKAFCRLQAGEFPDYRQVVPDKLRGTAVFDRGALLRKIARMKALATGRDGLELTLGEDTLTLEFRSGDHGEGAEALTAENVAGPRLQVGVRVAYLHDALSAIADDKVAIGWNDDVSPLVFSPTSGTAWKFVVMPMRL